MSAFALLLPLVTMYRSESYAATVPFATARPRPAPAILRSVPHCVVSPTISFLVYKYWRKVRHDVLRIKRGNSLFRSSISIDVSLEH
jgi:hypothetical protein